MALGRLNPLVLLKELLLPLAEVIARVTLHCTMSPTRLGSSQSVNGVDLRYLGPSSRLLFTRLVLTGLGRKVQMEISHTPDPEANDKSCGSA